MLLHESLLTLENMTEICIIPWGMNYTGLTWYSVFSSGLQRQFIVVFMAWLQNTSLNCFSVKQRPSSRYQLRSSQSNQLIVPLVKLSTYGPRSFAVAGPTIWNNLPEYLRDPELSIDNFRRQLKTFLFAQHWKRDCSALETLCLCAL